MVVVQCYRRTEAPGRTFRSALTNMIIFNGRILLTTLHWWVSDAWRAQVKKKRRSKQAHDASSEDIDVSMCVVVGNIQEVCLFTGMSELPIAWMCITG